MIYSTYTAFAGTVFLALTFALVPLSTQTIQSEQCSKQDLRALLQPGDSAYAMAMSLAQTLGTKGFTVKCVLRSKMSGLFKGQKGEALFRTHLGDFEAIFLPKEITFEQMTVIERRRNGWYNYSFEGDPEPLPPNEIQSPRRQFFVMQSNFLLETSSDELAEKLRLAVAK